VGRSGRANGAAVGVPAFDDPRLLGTQEQLDVLLGPAGGNYRFEHLDPPLR